MKYFGKDAPRDRKGGSPTEGQLIWNTTWSWDKERGYTTEQRTQAAWPAAYNEWIALQGANRNATLEYVPGGYANLRLSSQASALDPSTGYPIQDPTKKVGDDVWEVNTAEQTVDIWDYGVTKEFLNLFVAGGAGDFPKLAQDRKAVWRSLVESWSDNILSVTLTDNSSGTPVEVELPVDYDNLLRYWVSYTGNNPDLPGGWTAPVTAAYPNVQSFLSEYASGLRSAYGTVYTITRRVRVPDGYTLAGDIHVGVSQVWTIAQIQATGMPTWLAPATGNDEWLKRTSRTTYTRNDSFELEESWESGTYFSSYYYAPYAGP